MLIHLHVSTEHSRGRTPLLLSVLLGKECRYWRLKNQLLPNALCGFMRELTICMFLLHHYFLNELPYCLSRGQTLMASAQLLS